MSDDDKGFRRFMDEWLRSTPPDWPLRSELSSFDVGLRHTPFAGLGRPEQIFVVAPPDLMPKRRSKGAAGFDLCSAVDIEVSPGQRLRIPTGVRLALPAGHEGQVRPRSSLSLAGFEVQLGTIDSDYRGEVAVVAVNSTSDVWIVRRGDRIAQLVVARLAPVVMTAVEVLDETERGESGFGSTGR